MLWFINFANKTEGLYTVEGRVTRFDPATHPLLKREHLITSDADIEGYCVNVESKNQSDYSTFTIQQVQSGVVSMETIKLNRHIILIGGEWELTAKLKKVWPCCFEFRLAGGDTLYTSEFGLGEPVDY